MLIQVNHAIFFWNSLKKPRHNSLILNVSVWINWFTVKFKMKFSVTLQEVINLFNSIAEMWVEDKGSTTDSFLRYPVRIQPLYIIVKHSFGIVLVFKTVFSMRAVLINTDVDNVLVTRLAARQMITSMLTLKRRQNKPTLYRW